MQQVTTLELGAHLTELDPVRIRGNCLIVEENEIGDLILAIEEGGYESKHTSLCPGDFLYIGPGLNHRVTASVPAAIDTIMTDQLDLDRRIVLRSFTVPYSRRALLARSHKQGAGSKRGQIWPCLPTTTITASSSVQSDLPLDQFIPGEEVQMIVLSADAGRFSVDALIADENLVVELHGGMETGLYVLDWPGRCSLRFTELLGSDHDLAVALRAL